MYMYLSNLKLYTCKILASMLTPLVHAQRFFEIQKNSHKKFFISKVSMGDITFDISQTVGQKNKKK